MVFLLLRLKRIMVSLDARLGKFRWGSTIRLDIGEERFSARFSRRFIIIRLAEGWLVRFLIKVLGGGLLGQGSFVIAFASCLSRSILLIGSAPLCLLVFFLTCFSCSSQLEFLTRVIQTHIHC